MSRFTERQVVGAIYVAAMFMNIMDATIVNVALPTLGRTFGVGTSGIQWVVLGYLLSLAVWIPASGWLGDRFGQRRIFLIALAAFTTASLLCGLSTSLTELVVFRVLQGVGGGMLTPVGTAMLFRTYPPEARARASRVLIIPTIVAPATGPVLGGLLVTHLSWRWIFFVNLPIGALAFVAGVFLLHEYREESAGRFDLAGFLLSGGGLALTLYALSEGPANGWSSPSVLSTGLVGVLLLAVTIRVELTVSEPMLDLRLLGNRMFARGNAAMALGSAAFIGTLFAVPLYLQEGRGLSALGSGLSTFPEAIGVVSAAQIAARIYGRIGPRRLVVGGLLGVTAIGVLLALFGGTTNLWWFRLAMYGLGLGMGFIFMPLQAATFATIDRSDTGRASAFFMAQRQTAGAFGVAVVATLLTSSELGGVPAFGGFHHAFLATGVLACLGAAVALRIRDTDAAATMVRGGGRASRTEAGPGAGSAVPAVVE